MTRARRFTTLVAFTILAAALVASQDPRRFQFTLSDALDVASRDSEARRRMIERNCQPGDMVCPNEIDMEMNEVVTNLESQATDVGRLAAQAGILVYTLHLNTSFLDAFSPDAPTVSQTLMRESGVYAKALDTFNGSAGGTFLEVNAGPDSAIDRVVRETSKYYLLGVEPLDADRDGKPHQIRVKVNQGGTSVRNRPTVVIPKRGT